MARKAREDGVPSSWRQAITDHLREWIRLNPGLTDRAAAERLLMSAPAYNGARRGVGTLGIRVLVQLRNGLRVPIDDLIGLPPLPRAKTAELPASPSTDLNPDAAIEAAVERALARRFDSRGAHAEESPSDIPRTKKRSDAPKA